MRLAPFLVALAACGDLGSVQSNAPDASTPTDSAAGPDGTFTCRTAITLKSTMEGHAGGSGGGKGPALACTNSFNERIVGVAIQMSNGTTTYGARSAQGIRIACASVTVAPSGTVTVGAITEHEVSGNGQYGWSPSTWTAMQQCPNGSVVTGILTHTGTNNDLFVDVSIICSQLGADGSPSNPQTIKVVGSLTAPTNPVQAQCGAGQVVSQLGTWTGAGLDAVDLFCSPSVCS